MLVRKTETENLEDQIKALKELQQQPGFRSKRPLAVKKENRFGTSFKKIFSEIRRWFSRSK